MKTFCFFLIILMSSLAGCKKAWFDEKSDIKLSVPATLKDFEFLLNDESAIASVSPALGEVSSDGHYLTEARWLSVGSTSPIVTQQKNAYTWSNTYVYEQVLDWNQSYKKIFVFNLVLDGLRKLDPALETSRYNQIKGNALFLRAKAFYELAQIYAPQYQAATAATDLGIPLKDGIDVTEITKRSSVKENYDQILTDLLAAIDLLPLKASYLIHGSKLACYGQLARVYLTMGNYEKAGFYANSVLIEQNNLLNFSLIPATNTNLGRDNEEVFLHSLLGFQSFTFQAGDIFIDQSLFNLFNANDLRKTRYFNVTANGIVYKGSYNNNGAVGFSGLATDEMYLIRAECYARAGNFSLAMKDVNDLLRTRWAKNSSGITLYVDQTAGNELDALNIIFLERKKELLLRGLRWVDLRRLNLDNRFKITLARTIGGLTYTLEPNGYQYTFPIPNDEISLSGIQQNPGW